LAVIEFADMLDVFLQPLIGERRRGFPGLLRHVPEIAAEAL
jgi:hypothetical protein